MFVRSLAVGDYFGERALESYVTPSCYYVRFSFTVARSPTRSSAKITNRFPISGINFLIFFVSLLNLDTQLSLHLRHSSHLSSSSMPLHSLSSTPSLFRFSLKIYLAFGKRKSTNSYIFCRFSFFCDGKQFWTPRPGGYKWQRILTTLLVILTISLFCCVIVFYIHSQ